MVYSNNRYGHHCNNNAVGIGAVGIVNAVPYQMVAGSGYNRVKPVSYHTRPAPGSSQIHCCEGNRGTVVAKSIHRRDSGIGCGNSYNCLIIPCTAVGICYCVCYGVVSCTRHGRIKGVARNARPGPYAPRVYSRQCKGWVTGAYNATRKDGGVRFGINGNGCNIKIGATIGIGNIISDGVCARSGCSRIKCVG